MPYNFCFRSGAPNITNLASLLLTDEDQESFDSLSSGENSLVQMLRGVVPQSIANSVPGKLIVKTNLCRILTDFLSFGAVFLYICKG